MAFRLHHHSFAATNQPTFPPKKCFTVKHHYSKTPFVALLNQNLRLSENGKRQEAIHMRHARAVEEIKRVLGRQNVEESLSMVDSIQRFGIEYQFQEEIAEVLHHVTLLKNRANQGNNYHQQLSKVALQFRLLRQGGHCIHLDVFDEFWNDKKGLKHTLYEDIKGLVSLFEASQLSIPGEDSLDEAGDFCRQLLGSYVSRFHDHPKAKGVAHTLRSPIHRTLPRFMNSTFQLENSSWTSSLQELVKSDNQICSSLHLTEIAAVSRWWKDLGWSKKLKFVRNEPIKWYIWPMACIPDPRFSNERIELTKPLSLIYVVDDIFDRRGTIDELTLFTEAVKRWDPAAMEQLPDYMKECFKALYDITNEFAFKTYIKHGWDPIETLVKSWVRLLNAFLEEARWLDSGNLPKAEEYLKNGIVSTGAHAILVHAFFLMGEGITKDNVALLDEFPPIISATATILRLCDDLEGDKDINKDQRDGSYLKCYMKEHPQLTIEQTQKHVRDEISEAWKRLNQEWLIPANKLPPSFAKTCMNAVRIVPLMYSYDGNSASKLEEHLKSLLIGGGGGGGGIQRIAEDHTNPLTMH